jgi:hypothetical protein
VFGLVPSVVWSGNGYHIYIQIEPLNTTLEETPEFSRFKEPSKEKKILQSSLRSIEDQTMWFFPYTNCPYNKMFIGYTLTASD